jgi:flagellar P-ring protein precursor FlgI
VATVLSVEGPRSGIDKQKGTLLMKSRIVTLTVAAVIAFWLAASAPPAEGQTLLKSICRVKGQEENTLQGMGFVVGLAGTGDGGRFLPTIRSLAKAMALMGEKLGGNGLSELKDAKNVALVTVTATVPAAGARQGDQLDCVVSSIGSAKSLLGGRLFLTPLMGPDRRNPRIYAFAEGPITLDDSALGTTGRIHGGCRLEEEFFNVFTQDGRITLVLDKNHAEFQVAQDIADLINDQFRLQSGDLPLAKALDQANVTVDILSQYRDDPVDFVSQVLALPMYKVQTGARVVINERTGSIVIDGDVEIGAVVVSHKNISLETGGAAAGASFVPIDAAQTESPKLKALVAALNAVHVPPADMIEIIKRLHRSGKLHARLIVE